MFKHYHNSNCYIQDSLRKPDTEVRPILIPDTVPKAVGFVGALKIPVSTNNCYLQIISLWSEIVFFLNSSTLVMGFF